MCLLVEVGGEVGGNWKVEITKFVLGHVKILFPHTSQSVSIKNLTGFSLFQQRSSIYGRLTPLFACDADLTIVLSENSECYSPLTLRGLVSFWYFVYLDFLPSTSLVWF